jgi:sugar phosphate isomerase/epimerase
MPNLTRRNVLLTGGVAALTSSLMGFMSDSLSAEEKPAKMPFRPCINFGTFLGFNLTFEEEIDVAAKAGYRSIEPWPNQIEQFLERGGRLSDARKRIDDHGLIVENLNTFYPWMVDDDAMRAEGIEQMKRYMDWALQLGTERIGATSVGATEVRLDDFRVLGDRYRTILEVGDRIGVWSLLEMWGKVKTLNSLADCLAVAAWAGHPKAMFLFDVFHLYHGGSPVEGLLLVNGKKIHTFHVHDYPADPPRERIEDEHRVYCGDGVAPLKTIFRTLRDINFEGCLSFEVFNPAYRATNDPLLVAKTGLEKLNAVLADVR